MRSLLKVFAYICIWTTPFQVACVLWGIGIVSVTNYSILSLSNIEFITNYLGFFLPVIDWAYTWIWNVLLDWVLSLPMVLHQALKAIITTWLGFWMLKKLS
tara:strand:- start:730 stop:1032 length:303 start_codon:yes stop_codon:yes gene_type:complete